MNTLLEYYENHGKHELKTELAQNSSPNYIIGKIQDDIQNLTDINGEYIQQLTPSQARVALKGLGEINQLLNLMIGILPPDLPLDSNDKDFVESSSKTSFKSIIGSAVLSGGTGGIAGSIIGYLMIKEQVPNIPLKLISNIDKTTQKFDTTIKQKFPKIAENYPDFKRNIDYIDKNKFQIQQYEINPIIPIAIGFISSILIAAVIAYFFVYQRYKQQQKFKPKANFTLPERNQVQFTEDILDFLHDKFEDIDNQVVKESIEKPKPPTPKLEDHQEILNFIQSFIGEVSDEEANLQSLTGKWNQQLTDILIQNDIEVVFFQPDIEDKSKFDFVRNIDPEVKEYVTLTPALIKDEIVIRRGRVLRPANS